MNTLINRLRLVLTAGDELDDVIAEKKKAKKEAEALKTIDYLKLCSKHQQATPAVYSKHNCDYCAMVSKAERNRNDGEQSINVLLQKIDKLEGALVGENILRQQVRNLEEDLDVLRPI